jgi:glycosyltransferase involved in cell wall biosynthesis
MTSIPDAGAQDINIAVVSDDRVCRTGDGRYYSSTGYDWRRVADMFSPDRPRLFIYCRIFSQASPPIGWSRLELDSRTSVIELPWFHKYTFLLKAPGALQLLRKKLREADLVWLVVPNLYSVLAYRVARSSRKRVLVWAVGDIEETALGVYDEWPIRLTYRIYAAVTKAIVRRADAIAVASHALDRKYASDMSSVIAYRSLRDPFLFEMERSLEGRKQRTILYVGRLTGEKGPQTLVEAMASVLEATPDAHLILAGDGPLRTELEELAANCGVAGHVEFTGWVGVEGLRELYARADVFCLPSHSEGMPGALLEALAARLPVVVTRVGDMPILVEPGGAGRVVPPNDTESLAAALIDILGSPEEWRTMSENAARVAAENSLDQQTGKVVEAARAVLNRPPLAQPAS